MRLPAITTPYRRVLQRKHNPRDSNNFRDFHSCLRWEFGFTCAFCLLHEADIMKTPYRSWGVMNIEHFILRSESISLETQYENLFFVCGLCNRDRGKKPHKDVEKGVGLLNPCSVAWADHFVAVDHKLIPKASDQDAEYTADCYLVNRQIKVTLRKYRSNLYEKLAKLEATILKLRSLILERNELSLVETLQELEWVHQHTRHVILESFQAVPQDAPANCRCKETPLKMPEVLVEQLQPEPLANYVAEDG